MKTFTTVKILARRSLCVFTLLSLALSAPGYAGDAANPLDPTPSPSASSGPTPDYQATCGDIDPILGQTKEQLARKSMDIQMRANYCLAARSGLKGRDFQTVMAILWGHIVTVCASACITAYIPYASAYSYVAQQSCTYSNLGATATQTGLSIALAKDAGEAFAAIGSGVASLAASVGGSKMAEEIGKNAVNGSCITGTSATVNLGMAIKARLDNEKTMDQNLRSAANLLGNKGGTGGPGPSGGGSNLANLGGGGSALRPTGGGGGGSNPTPPTNKDICSTAAETRAFAPSLACASSYGGGGLPPGIFKSGFGDEFKKAMGADPDAYGQRFGSDVASSMGAGLQGPLGAEGAGKVSAGMRAQLDKTLAALGAAPSSYYASSGGGRSGSHGGADDGFGNISEMMKGLLGGMPGMGKKTGNENANRTLARFGGPGSGTRAGRAVEEDPSVSLFDRVSSRYRDKTPAVGDQWALPLNRASHGVK